MLLSIYELFVMLQIDWCFQVDGSVELLSSLLAPPEKSQEMLGHNHLDHIF